ncbi:hypothetical protein GCM10009124_15970 [Shewanella xiamenensis]|nr:hypothetical protein GCM10009124_15970 [Shewanella xiamenensis]
MIPDEKANNAIASINSIDKFHTFYILSFLALNRDITLEFKRRGITITDVERGILAGKLNRAYTLYGLYKVTNHNYVVHTKVSEQYKCSGCRTLQFNTMMNIDFQSEK